MLYVYQSGLKHSFTVKVSNKARAETVASFQSQVISKILERFCSPNIRTCTYGRGANIREFRNIRTVSVEK